jgi:hypothetical protein
MKYFNNEVTQTNYFYIAKQVITNPKKKVSFNFCEIKQEFLNKFIDDHLTKDNNLFEIIRPYSQVKLFAYRKALRPTLNLI